MCWVTGIGGIEVEQNIDEVNNGIFSGCVSKFRIVTKLEEFRMLKNALQVTIDYQGLTCCEHF